MRDFTLPDMHQIERMPEPDLTPIDHDTIRLTVGEKGDEDAKDRRDIQVILLNGVKAGHWFEQLDIYEPDTHLVFESRSYSDIDVPLPIEHRHTLDPDVWTDALVERLKHDHAYAVRAEQEVKDLVTALEAIEHPAIRDVTAKLIDKKLRSQRHTLWLHQMIRELLTQART